MLCIVDEEWAEGEVLKIVDVLKTWLGFEDMRLQMSDAIWAFRVAWGNQALIEMGSRPTCSGNHKEPPDEIKDWHMDQRLSPDNFDASPCLLFARL